MYIERLLFEYWQISFSGLGGLLMTFVSRIVEAALAIVIALILMKVIQTVLKKLVENTIPRFFSVGSEEVRIERTKNVVTSVVRFLTIFFWLSWVWAIILIVMFELGVLGTAISLESWLTVLYKILLICAILVGVELALTFSNFAVDKWVESIDDGDPAFSSIEKRARTISHLLKNTFRYILYFVAFMMILKEIGLDIGPALAGAGVLGLAIGFGAQTLVKDILSGFFILFEGQFHVGDYIKVGTVQGTVEKMALRLTVIRSFDGALHMFPNSTMDSVTLMSRGYSRAIVDVGVTYNEDVDVLRQTITEIVADFEHPDILEKPVVLGVTNLGDSAVIFRVVVQTKPLSHWSVERELRQVIKRGLDQRGIEIPFPQQVVHYIPESSQSQYEKKISAKPVDIKSEDVPSPHDEDELGDNK